MPLCLCTPAFVKLMKLPKLEVRDNLLPPPPTTSKCNPRSEFSCDVEADEDSIVGDATGPSNSSCDAS